MRTSKLGRVVGESLIRQPIQEQVPANGGNLLRSAKIFRTAAGTGGRLPTSGHHKAKGQRREGAGSPSRERLLIIPCPVYFCRLHSGPRLPSGCGARKYPGSYGRMSMVLRDLLARMWFRPRLEVLEGRVLLATCTVTRLTDL